MELPEVARLHERYGSRGLVVIGVHDSSGKPEEIATALRERGVKYPVIRDGDERETFSAYRIIGIPHFVLIGKDGTVLADGEPLKRMEERIEQELGVP